MPPAGQRHEKKVIIGTDGWKLRRDMIDHCVLAPVFSLNYAPSCVAIIAAFDLFANTACHGAAPTAGVAEQRPLRTVAEDVVAVRSTSDVSQADIRADIRSFRFDWFCSLDDLWLLGWLVVPIAGNLVHLLLVIILVVVVIRLVQGRPPV